MAISIPASLVEFILIGPTDDRRQLQDSPILGDVWIAFGQEPDRPRSLLISPYKTREAGQVAATIAEAIDDDDDHDPGIAYLQGLVIADLTFREVLRFIIPKTSWWIDKWEPLPPPAPAKGKKAPRRTSGRSPASGITLVMPGPGRKRRRFANEIARRYFSPESGTLFSDTLRRIIAAARAWQDRAEERHTLDLLPIDRFSVLTGLILWAAEQENDEKLSEEDAQRLILKRLSDEKGVERVLDLLTELANEMFADDFWKDVKTKLGGIPLVWSISRNRTALPAIARSVPAVKADAATTLFDVNCSDIAWAVLDSGIDGGHPAFKPDGGTSRVIKTYDFRNFRRIVSLSNLKPNGLARNLKHLMDHEAELANKFDNAKEAEKDLKLLAEDAKRKGPIHWELVERFVELKPETQPATSHGTHVAGIIGANGKTATVDDDLPQPGGMCPDIRLYDFRVLGNDLQDTEFAIIAALQFIRHLNDRDAFLSIHGANLSLSIPHDVRNYACGRTPICDECERLINSGVVVVVAAGNHGYKSFQTKDGPYPSYAAFSITDPGNADGVITVGSTHRFWPHTYGVSFFSSRGPTGDGRLKPDLVAPGERIRAPFPREGEVGAWGQLDGTSMAAPHVSGAAAMLLARYAELIGQPRRVKQILCDSATDLGRERSFQGHGMLDVLRAFQSI